MHESRQDKTISEAGRVWMRAQEVESQLTAIRAEVTLLEDEVALVLSRRTPDEVITAGIDMDTAIAGLRDTVESL